jgi:thioredoxin-related protein
MEDPPGRGGVILHTCPNGPLSIYSPGNGYSGKEHWMTLRRTAIILLAAALLAGCAGDETGAGGANTWMSFREGMELAGKLRKPVVIDFYTSWCRWCKVMDRETFSNEKVASYLNEHFISIRLNAEQTSGSIEFGGREYTPASLARAFKLRGYPSIAYLDNEGGLIFVDPGFKKPAQFMTNLKYVTSGCYRNDVSIEEFRRRGGKCD